MAILDRLDLGFGRQRKTDDLTPAQDADQEITNVQVTDKETGAAPADDQSIQKGPDMPVDPDAQRGVQKIEAVTSAWSKWSLAGLLFKYVCSVSPVHDVG